MKHTYDELEMGTNVIDGFTVRIERDDYPESPRDWDNIGTMVCWASRYQLGDEQPNVSPEDYQIGMLGDVMEYEHHPVLREKLQDAIEALEEGEAGEGTLQKYLEKYYVILPLYLYDHSGITMNTTGFSCPWDSGQTGFIYASRRKLAEEGIEDGEAALRQEVETYDQYITGDVWYYAVEDDEDNMLDSCSGFFGFDYVREQAIEALNACIEERKREHFEAIKVWIRNGVPLGTRQHLIELGEDRR